MGGSAGAGPGPPVGHGVAALAVALLVAVHVAGAGLVAADVAEQVDEAARRSGGPDVAVLPPDAGATDGPRGFDQDALSRVSAVPGVGLLVTATGGTDPASLVGPVRTALGGSTQVLTRAELLDRRRGEVVRANDLDELVPVQVALAVLTLLLGGLVAAATFGAAVARRRRADGTTASGPGGAGLAPVVGAGALVGLLALVGGLVFGAAALAVAELLAGVPAASALAAPAEARWPLLGGLLAHAALAVVTPAVATLAATRWPIRRNAADQGMVRTLGTSST